MLTLRAYDTSIKRKTQVFLGSKGLEKGYPCGLRRDGRAVQINEQHEGFLGFIESNLEKGQCLVVTRGAVRLKIEDIHKAKVGTPIFCSGANEFTLSGGCLVGVLKYIQLDMPNYGLVCFKRFDDAEPFNLK